MIVSCQCSSTLMVKSSFQCIFFEDGPYNCNKKHYCALSKTRRDLIYISIVSNISNSKSNIVLPITKFNLLFVKRYIKSFFNLSNILISFFSAKPIRVCDFINSLLRNASDLSMTNNLALVRFEVI